LETDLDSCKVLSDTIQLKDIITDGLDDFKRQTRSQEKKPQSSGKANMDKMKLSHITRSKNRNEPGPSDNEVTGRSRGSSCKGSVDTGTRCDHLDLGVSVNSPRRRRCCRTLAFEAESTKYTPCKAEMNDNVKEKDIDTVATSMKLRTRQCSVSQKTETKTESLPPVTVVDQQREGSTFSPRKRRSKLSSRKSKPTWDNIKEPSSGMHCEGKVPEGGEMGHESVQTEDKVSQEEGPGDVIAIVGQERAIENKAAGDSGMTEKCSNEGVQTEEDKATTAEVSA